jgi:hypothetical protein
LLLQSWQAVPVCWPLHTQLPSAGLHVPNPLHVVEARQYLHVG